MSPGPEVKDRFPAGGSFRKKPTQFIRKSDYLQESKKAEIHENLKGDILDSLLKFSGTNDNNTKKMNVTDVRASSGLDEYEGSKKWEERNNREMKEKLNSFKTLKKSKEMLNHLSNY